MSYLAYDRFFYTKRCVLASIALRRPTFSSAKLLWQFVLLAIVTVQCELTFKLHGAMSVHERNINSEFKRAVRKTRRINRKFATKGLQYSTSTETAQQQPRPTFHSIQRWPAGTPVNKATFSLRPKPSPPVGLPYCNRQAYTPCLKKTVQNCFCQNFLKFPLILIICDRKIAKRLTLCQVHSFSTSSISRHHTTVLNADVPNCQATQRLKLLSAINFLAT